MQDYSLMQIYPNTLVNMLVKAYQDGYNTALLNKVMQPQGRVGDAPVGDYVVSDLRKAQRAADREDEAF